MSVYIYDVECILTITDYYGEKIVLDWDGIKISNSINNIGCTCEISLPVNLISNFVYAGTQEGKNYLNQPIRKVLKTGYRVSVSYNGVTYLNGKAQRTEKITGFTGYVYSFKDGYPSSIFCKDESYNFDQGIVTKHWKGKVTLQEIFEYLISATNTYLGNLKPAQEPMNMKADTSGGNVTFDSYYIRNSTPLSVLEQLKRDTGLIISINKKKKENGDLEYFLVSTTSSNTISSSGIKDFSDGTNVYECDVQEPNSTFENFTVKVNRVDPKTGVKTFFYMYLNNNGKIETVNQEDSKGIESIFKRKEEVNASNMNLEDAKTLGQSAIYKNTIYQYTGSLKTSIYDNVEILDLINYVSHDFPNRNGRYLVRGTSVNIDSNNVVIDRTLDIGFINN